MQDFFVEKKNIRESLCFHVDTPGKDSIIARRHGQHQAYSKGAAALTLGLLPPNVCPPQPRWWDARLAFQRRTQGQIAGSRVQSTDITQNFASPAGAQKLTVLPCLECLGKPPPRIRNCWVLVVGRNSCQPAKGPAGTNLLLVTQMSDRLDGHELFNVNYKHQIMIAVHFDFAAGGVGYCS